MDNELRWPAAARPGVRLAGLFPLDGRGFAFVYRTRFHAIHLHEYPGTIRLEGRDHALEPGTLTVSPAGGASSYDLPRPGVHWCIHFAPQPVLGRAPCLRLPLVRRLGAAQGEAVRRFSHIARLHELLPDAGNGAAALREAAAVALQELLVWYALFERMNAHRAARPGKFAIEGLLDYIDRNLGRRLYADELAAHAGLSQNHLARIFRERTGVTLPSYVLGRRINLARLLLGTTNLPIKQIAPRVGMPDPHHFNKQFRAIVGVSPTRFRRGDSAGGAGRQAR